MNRRQKIIISVTGIFLVALILVGLTYAYFLTQITGNTNSKSISIETANLKLTYGDGTTELLTSSTKLVPSSNPINTKDFTVTNTGDDTTYVVMIENVRAKVAGTDTLTTFDSNDFKYTLTCTKKDGTSCNGVLTQTTLPMSDNILVENDIDSGDVHTYVITVWYLDNGKDQSSDMNKTLEAKINIEDPNRINPYSNNTNSLAYNIINNAFNVSEENESKGYAVYREEPLTEPGVEMSSKVIGSDLGNYSSWKGISNYTNRYFVVGDDYIGTTKGFVLVNPRVVQYSSGYQELKGNYTTHYGGYSEIEAANSLAVEGKSLNTIYKVSEDTDLTAIYYRKVNITPTESVESTLSITTDDYKKTTGLNTYYFRGAVANNYLNFAGMCWRIVRIQGDGSVKLMLASELACSTENLTESSALMTDGQAGILGNVIEIEFGYTYQNESYTDDLGNTYDDAYFQDYINDTSQARNALNSWLERKITNETDLEKIKKDTWILNDNIKDENKIGMISWDELEYAGLIHAIAQTSNYAVENSISPYGGYGWWTISLTGSGGYFLNNSYGDYVVRVDNGAGSIIEVAYTNLNIKPVITLKNGTEITGGTGVIDDPYIVKVN